MSIRTTQELETEISAIEEAAMEAGQNIMIQAFIKAIELAVKWCNGDNKVLPPSTAIKSANSEMHKRGLFS